VIAAVASRRTISSSAPTAFNVTLKPQDADDAAIRRRLNVPDPPPDLHRHAAALRTAACGGHHRPAGSDGIG
jgi:hypothetical protein